MDKQIIIEGLRSLIDDRESFIDKEDPNCIFKYDKKILEEAIKVIETALEVPVQEQSKKIAILLDGQFIAQTLTNRDTSEVVED